MTLEQLAYVADTIGVVVVVFTLPFLSMQVAQITKSLRSGAAQTAHDERAEICSPLVNDSTFADIFLRVSEDPGPPVGRMSSL